ncbi:SDR family NAD(P)-dependent oxidoreductase [Micromonospora sp. NPDC050397]|uniref:SDR family NAD(P)-dependent oxidoreductase n=1 Tax=Micromonospora sp. NPDC050397 TaxID=3364279 RepID=UPI00384DE971
MSPADLSGKVALVTGVSGYLGGAIARTLAGRGATVVGTYHRSARRAEDLVAELRDKGGQAHAVAADLAEPRACADILARVRAAAGPPEILVCAHGGTERRGVLETRDRDSAARLWRVNVDAAVTVAGLAAKAMIRRRSGRIVLVGSRAGIAGMPGQADYAAAKAALQAWAASAAWELGPFGITVNVVAPGAMEADPLGPAVYSKEENEVAAGRTAARRLGTAAEVAATVAFLASAGAAYVTGQTIAVDGGARW